MTYDQLAARYMLAGKPIPKALIDHAASACGALCPNCGSTHTEDNGANEYRCVDCDRRWGFEYGGRYGF